MVVIDEAYTCLSPWTKISVADYRSFMQRQLCTRQIRNIERSRLQVSRIKHYKGYKTQWRLRFYFPFSFLETPFGCPLTSHQPHTAIGVLLDTSIIFNHRRHAAARWLKRFYIPEFEYRIGGWLEIRRRNPASAGNLFNDIAFQSCRVFLWAHLVVKSLQILIAPS